MPGTVLGMATRDTFSFVSKDLGVIWHRTNVGGVDGARGALGQDDCL